MDDYDPEWIKWENAAGRPDLPEDIIERRNAFNAALVGLSKMLPPTSSGTQTRDEQISSEVKIRIYAPEQSQDRKCPLIVFCHGGGWLAGNLDTEDHMCRVVCERVNCIVVSVDYRLFPEVLFPSPIDDCLLAYQWAHSHANELGADRKRFSIWGGSAGGALAVAVAYRLVSTGQGDKIFGLIVMAGLLVHPEAIPSKYSALHTSYVDNGGEVPVVTGEAMLAAFGMLTRENDIHDVDMFPIAGAPKSLAHFPRTYIINTSKEANRDDGRVLEAALEDAGTPVKRDVIPGFPHYFWCFPIEKGGARLRETIVKGIKWVVDPA